MYNGANFASYFWLKRVWLLRRGAAMPPLVGLFAGMLAGSFASSIAMPLNVLTTKRQASRGLSGSRASATAAEPPSAPEGGATSCVRMRLTPRPPRVLRRPTPPPAR